MVVCPKCGSDRLIPLTFGHDADVDPSDLPAPSCREVRDVRRADVRLAVTSAGRCRSALAADEQARQLAALTGSVWRSKNHRRNFARLAADRRVAMSNSQAGSTPLLTPRALRTTEHH